MVRVGATDLLTAACFLAEAINVRRFLYRSIGGGFSVDLFLFFLPMDYGACIHS